MAIHEQIPKTPFVGGGDREVIECPEAMEQAPVFLSWFERLTRN
jgi:hypothetical protein